MILVKCQGHFSLQYLHMDDVFGLYDVHTSSEEEQVNKYFERVAVSYPPPH